MALGRCLPKFLVATAEWLKGEAYRKSGGTGRVVGGKPWVFGEQIPAGI